MNKKRRNSKKDDASLSLKDSLNEDVLAKLQSAKQTLKKEAEAEEKALQEKKRREREEKEKNKSFEELLEEYGDIGSKY